jgi:ATP/ADP translocase
VATRRLRSIAARVVDIKPAERAISLFLFSYFFLITAPYYIIKPLRNASYLDRLSDEKLPLAYLLTAVIMGFIVNLHSRLQVRLPRHVLIVASVVFFFFNILAFWLLFRTDWKWVPTLFWVWANIFAVVLVTQFWILFNDIFNPREAKRLIGFVGSGGLLGAICGSVLAGSLARTRFFDHLLLLAAGMLGLGIVAVYGIFRWQRRRKAAPEKAKAEAEAPAKSAAAAKVGFRDAFNTTRQSRYLMLLAGIMLATWVVSTLIDFQFNSVVSRQVEEERNLASFFGYFNAGTMAFAFLLQLLLTGRIIQLLRIRLTLLVYPLALLLCSTGIGLVVYASLIPAILIKASDKGLAYSLNQSVRELLYIPISPEQKYKSKIFIDMFLNRFAKGLGAIILLVLLAIFGKGTDMAIRSISVATIICISGWIALNLRVWNEYNNMVKGRLELKYERADHFVDKKLDVEYAKLVFDTIESKNKSSVLYAMHLFDLIRRDQLTPEIKKLISCQADGVRAASLGTLIEQGETCLGPELDNWLPEEVLKKEVQEIVSLDVYQEVMKGYLDKALQGSGPGNEVARMEAAKSIGLMEPNAPLVEKLDDLLGDESVEVSRYAMQSAAQLQRKEDVPALVWRLRHPVLRADAADALFKFGGRIVGTLADFLADKSEHLEVRTSVASALARIGTQEAADFLSWQLAEGEEELNPAVIDALDRIRTGHPDIRFDQGTIKSEIRREARAYCRNFVRLYAGLKKSDTVLRWEKTRESALWNILQLLGLIYSHEDMAKVYQNLKAGTKNSVAYAIELLDNLLERDMREAVFPLVEDLPPEEKLRRCRHLLGNSGAERGGGRHDE